MLSCDLSKTTGSMIFIDLKIYIMPGPSFPQNFIYSFKMLYLPNHRVKICITCIFIKVNKSCLKFCVLYDFDVYVACNFFWKKKQCFEKNKKLPKTHILVKNYKVVIICCKRIKYYVTLCFYSNQFYKFNFCNFLEK